MKKINIYVIERVIETIEVVSNRDGTEDKLCIKNTVFSIGAILFDIFTRFTNQYSFI